MNLRFIHIDGKKILQKNRPDGYWEDVPLVGAEECVKEEPLKKFKGKLMNPIEDVDEGKDVYGECVNAGDFSAKKKKTCHPIQGPMFNIYKMSVKSCAVCGDSYWAELEEAKKECEHYWIEKYHSMVNGHRSYTYECSRCYLTDITSAKKEVEKIYWCQHALWNCKKQGWAMGETYSSPSIPESWQVCPICLAKRPAPEPKQKKLYEIISKAYISAKSPLPASEYFKIEASVALTAVIKCYEDWMVDGNLRKGSFKEYLTKTLGND